MSNLRNLNTPNNPLLDLLSSLNIPDHSNHPFFAAFNPEARDRGSPPSYPGNGGENNEDPPEVPPPSDNKEDSSSAPQEQGRGGSNYHSGPHHHGRGGFGGRGRGWGGPRGRCGGMRGAGPCGPGMGMGMGFGGFGGPPRGFPFAYGGNNFDMSKLGDFLSQFVPPEDAANVNKPTDRTDNNPSDFHPAADIFSTTESYVIHISLPGAKKEDVGVNWDADKSELSIAGVIYRPGDEEFLKTLALDERKEVGVFERKIKLGDKENPASVDVDGIGARMEDGILRVTVPKVESFVEVKKVDIE